MLVSPITTRTVYVECIIEYVIVNSRALITEKLTSTLEFRGAVGSLMRFIIAYKLIYLLPKRGARTEIVTSIHKVFYAKREKLLSVRWNVPMVYLVEILNGPDVKPRMKNLV